MRRTLTVLVATAALMVPAAAASAAPGGGQGAPGGQTNASCNNGKGGNYAWTGHTYNGKGNSGKAVDCRQSSGDPDSGDGGPVEEPTPPDDDVIF